MNDAGRSAPASASNSFAQSADDHLCRFGSGEVLLTGDEVTVANRESSPEPGPYIVGAEAFHLVLDSPRHDMLVAREKIHRPDRVVRVVFLHIGESGHGFPGHERCAVQAGIPQNGYPMTERTCNLA